MCNDERPHLMTNRCFVLVTILLIASPLTSPALPMLNEQINFLNHFIDELDILSSYVDISHYTIKDFERRIQRIDKFYADSCGLKKGFRAMGGILCANDTIRKIADALCSPLTLDKPWEKTTCSSMSWVGRKIKKWFVKGKIDPLILGENKYMFESALEKILQFEFEEKYTSIELLRKRREQLIQGVISLHNKNLENERKEKIDLLKEISEDIKEINNFVVGEKGEVAIYTNLAVKLKIESLCESFLDDRKVKEKAIPNNDVIVLGDETLSAYIPYVCKNYNYNKNPSYNPWITKIYAPKAMSAELVNTYRSKEKKELLPYIDTLRSVITKEFPETKNGGMTEHLTKWRDFYRYSENLRYERNEALKLLKEINNDLESLNGNFKKSISGSEILAEEDLIPIEVTSLNITTMKTEILCERFLDKSRIDNNILPDNDLIVSGDETLSSYIPYMCKNYMRRSPNRKWIKKTYAPKAMSAELKRKYGSEKEKESFPNIDKLRRFMTEKFPDKKDDGITDHIAEWRKVLYSKIP